MIKKLIINSSSAWTLLLLENIFLFMYDLGTPSYKFWACFLTFTSILFHSCKGEEDINENIRYIFGHLDALAIIGICSYYTFCIQLISINFCVLYIILINIKYLNEEYYKYVIYIIGLSSFLKNTLEVLNMCNKYNTYIYIGLFSMFIGHTLFIYKKGKLYLGNYSILNRWIWHLNCANYMIMSGYNINQLLLE